MIARPRTYVTYRFGFDSGAMSYIQCHTQRRWEVEKSTDGKKVKLSNKNVTIVIPREDFEEHWKEVE